MIFFLFLGSWNSSYTKLINNNEKPLLQDFYLFIFKGKKRSMWKMFYLMMKESECVQETDFPINTGRNDQNVAILLCLGKMRTTLHYRRVCWKTLPKGYVRTVPALGHLSWSSRLSQYFNIIHERLMLPKKKKSCTYLSAFCLSFSFPLNQLPAKAT